MKTYSSSQAQIFGTGNGRLLSGTSLSNRMVALLFLLFNFLSVPVVSAGISVSPISNSLDMTKQQSRLITVRNLSKERSVPVKLSVWKWALTNEGQDIREPSSDILVFPGQFLLEPDGLRAVRAAPRYREIPTIEHSYRILIRQLPVDLEGSSATTGVKFLTSFATAFYVQPTNPRSDVQFVNVTRNGDGLVFKLINNGNTHTHLRELVLLLSQGERIARFDDPEQLRRFYGENILAKSERHFTWHWPKVVSQNIDLRKPFSVRLKLKCEFCGRVQNDLTYSVP